MAQPRRKMLDLDTGGLFTRPQGTAARQPPGHCSISTTRLPHWAIVVLVNVTIPESSLAAPGTRPPEESVSVSGSADSSSQRKM